jgi:YebC/PmpR family DNA-binding regulatory protein
MGAQWKHKGRVENAAKRGQLISKMVKEIIMATKGGDPDPANNARLRVAVEAAKKASVPRENIERAIKRGAGLLDPVNYELVTFEGFTPHKVPVIVECLTENRNRTNADMKVLFRKGTLGATGSVAYLFDYVGLVVATPPNPAADPEEAAIEAGAQDVERTDEGAQFRCDRTDLVVVSKSLADAGWNISSAEFAYVPKDPIDPGEAARKEIEIFLGDLDDNDDVHRIFTALK